MCAFNSTWNARDFFFNSFICISAPFFPSKTKGHRIASSPLSVAEQNDELFPSTSLSPSLSLYVRFFSTSFFSFRCLVFSSSSSDLHPFFPALSSVLKKCSSSRYIPKQHSNKLSWAAATKSASHTVNLHKEAMSYICRSWIAVVVLLLLLFFFTTSKSLSCTFFFFRSQRWMLFFGFYSPYPVSHKSTHGCEEREWDGDRKKWSKKVFNLCERV